MFLLQMSMKEEPVQGSGNQFYEGAVMRVAQQKRLADDCDQALKLLSAAERPKIPQSVDSFYLRETGRHISGDFLTLTFAVKERGWDRKNKGVIENLKKLDFAVVYDEVGSRATLINLSFMPPITEDDQKRLKEKIASVRETARKNPEKAQDMWDAVAAEVSEIKRAYVASGHLKSAMEGNASAVKEWLEGKKQEIANDIKKAEAVRGRTNAEYLKKQGGALDAELREISGLNKKLQKAVESGDIVLAGQIQGQIASKGDALEKGIFIFKKQVDASIEYEAFILERKGTLPKYLEGRKHDIKTVLSLYGNVSRGLDAIFERNCRERGLDGEITALRQALSQEYDQAMREYTAKELVSLGKDGIIQAAIPKNRNIEERVIARVREAEKFFDSQLAFQLSTKTGEPKIVSGELAGRLRNYFKSRWGMDRIPTGEALKKYLDVQKTLEAIGIGASLISSFVLVPGSAGWIAPRLSAGTLRILRVIGGVTDVAAVGFKTVFLYKGAKGLATAKTPMEKENALDELRAGAFMPVGFSGIFSKLKAGSYLARALGYTGSGLQVASVAAGGTTLIHDYRFVKMAPFQVVEDSAAIAGGGMAASGRLATFEKIMGKMSPGARFAAVLIAYTTIFAGSNWESQKIENDMKIIEKMDSPMGALGEITPQRKK